MESDTGVPQLVMTPEQIAGTLQHLGPGSHTVVGVVRNSGMGHWFVAYNHNGTILTLDSQTGMVAGWPPAMGNVRFGHAGFHPSVVEAATGTTPALAPWTSHQSGIETPGGVAHPATGSPDLGTVWNPAFTPPPNLSTPAVGGAATEAVPSATPHPGTVDGLAGTDSNPSTAEYGSEPGRSPLNAREVRITERFIEFIEHTRGADMADGAMSPDELRVLDELMAGDDPVVAVGPDGRLVVGDQLELSTSCPAKCDPDEMNLQYRDANEVLNDLSVAEWLERRANFINKPPNYRKVSGSSEAQQAANNDWVRDHAVRLMEQDPSLKLRDARKMAKDAHSAAKLNATHRLDMVAGGDPTDISGVNGGEENQAIGRIFQQSFVPKMEEQVLRFLDRVPPSMWDAIYMNIAIREVS
jgi:hypothetical protein